MRCSLGEVLAGRLYLCQAGGYSNGWNKWWVQEDVNTRDVPYRFLIYIVKVKVSTIRRLSSQSLCFSIHYFFELKPHSFFFLSAWWRIPHHQIPYLCTFSRPKVKEASFASPFLLQEISLTPYPFRCQNKYARRLITYDMKSKQLNKLRETWEDPVSSLDAFMTISSLLCLN